jgi:[ribosomal protein S18]-alanine N-acetyltransferase
MIRWGKESARTGPWRADGSVAFLVPVPEGPPPSAEFVRRCLVTLAEQGFERVVTGALSPEEQGGFLEAGFDVHEELHLLVLDPAAPLPSPPPGPRVHRAGPLRRGGVLDVDAAAFAPFWRLDRAGLQEALGATPRRRLRVALGRGNQVVGYAICGASGGRGFVQRLAVVPPAQGHGIGKRLLLDGLQWLRSLGPLQVAVNTQKGNDAALALYRHVGFRDDPAGLCVLSAGLGPSGVN